MPPPPLPLSSSSSLLLLLDPCFVCAHDIWASLSATIHMWICSMRWINAKMKSKANEKLQRAKNIGHTYCSHTITSGSHMIECKSSAIVWPSVFISFVYFFFLLLLSFCHLYLIGHFLQFDWCTQIIFKFIHSTKTNSFLPILYDCSSTIKEICSFFLFVE